MSAESTMNTVFYHSDWMTVVLVLAGVLIWSVWRSAGGFLEQKSFEVIHGYDRKSLFAGDTLSELRIGLVLGTVHILVVGLFIHHLAFYFEMGRGLLNYVMICLLVFLYHVLKILVVNYFSYLLSAGKKTNTWFKSYNVFNLVLGLLLLPIVVVLTYNRRFGMEMGLNIGLFLIVIYLIALFVRSVNIFFTNFSSFVYVILYFCSLEILPLLLVAKVVLKTG